MIGNAKKLLASSINALKKNYDVINAQDIFATLASIESGIPTVQTVHGYYSFEAVSRAPFFRTVKKI
ncbi:hypothetical protein RCO48_13275 [Peribacillus frigoritolerans]|nr:hypothetical protein [Peribacillus frigoritolerans]